MASEKYYSEGIQGPKEKTVGSTPSSPSHVAKSQSPTSNGGVAAGDLTTHIQELEAVMREELTPTTRSRLLKTLDEVLHDNEALGYFIQYLDAVGCGSFVKCILDIESFNAAVRNTPKSLSESSPCQIVVRKDCGPDHRHSSSNSALPRCNTDELVIDSSTCDGYYSDSGCEDKSKSATSSSTVLSDTKVMQSEDDETNSVVSTEDEIISKLINTNQNDNVVDAIKIFKKYFTHNAPMKIVLKQDEQERLASSLKGEVNEHLFEDAKQHIMNKLEQDYFNDFLRSEFHCKYQIDVLTSSQVFLSDILYNDTALFYLMEFLEQEGWRAGLEFWMAANNYHEQYTASEGYDPAQAQDDAMILYDKYFSLQATNPLHLGDHVRLHVEESICREEGPLPTCFHVPQRLIVRLLDQRFLQPFLQSQLYLKYLSELITTIQASPALCARSRSRNSGSDCSSEMSISTTNTLLVSEDVNPPKRVLRNIGNSAMSIDARQLYDPDSLWRRDRDKRQGLSFGRVNELGRFETELEPEPDRKLESRIAKAVKKLVNLDEDKTKEEMAWQVAAMIVKDVTNVTLAAPSTEHP